MSVKVEKLENNMAKLIIEVSFEEFDKAVEAVYNHEKSRIAMPGFRKGKAPRKMIEKVYGAGVFYEDAANQVINAEYPKAARECGEDIVSNPSIGIEQIEPGKPFIFTAEVALKPPVELGKYKGVEVEKVEVSVTDEEVDQEIAREQEKNARVEEVTDRPVQDKDQITLDFEGFVDGEAFEGGKGEDYALTIGSGAFIPGFEDQLIGAEIGQEMEVNVTFPENYGAKDLAGKPAVFKCTVKSIKEKILPELNDEFADEVSEFSTLAEYREDVKKNILKKKEDAAKQAKEDRAVNAVVADSKIDIPAPMLRTQQEQMVDQMAQQLQMQGLSMEQYMQYTGMTRETMVDNMKDNAERRIRTRLCLEEVAKQENITATEEEYEAELQKMADQYHIDLDRVREIMEAEKETMMTDLAVQKAVTFITDNAVEVEPKAAEAEESAEEAPAEAAEE